MHVRVIGAGVAGLTCALELAERGATVEVLNGSLVVAQARDAADLVQFSRRTERFEWLDGHALAELEPDLGGRFNKALYFREEGHLDPRAALTALAQRLGG